MAARRLAADGHQIGTEFRFAVLQQPRRGIFAVVGTGGIWMFRRQAILDAHDRQASAVSDLLQHRVLHVSGTQYPAAAMEVKIDATRSAAGWANDPQRNFVAIPTGDGLHLGTWRKHRRRERSPARSPSVAGCLGAEVPPLGQRRHQVDEGLVQLGGIFGNRRGAEQSGVQRVVGHGFLGIGFDRSYRGPLVDATKPAFGRMPPGAATRYFATSPPSLTSSAPVTQADSSDARYRQPMAMSYGLPNRASGGASMRALNGGFLELAEVV